MLEAEREHRDGKPVGEVALAEQRTQLLAQLHGLQVARVDDDVRMLADFREQATLGGDALADRHVCAVIAHRMAAAACLVPRDNRLVAGIQEDDAVLQAGSTHMRELFNQLVVEVLVACVAHHGQAAARLLLSGNRRKAHEVHQQARRQVVDAEIAEILERVHRLGAARAAHARDDDQVRLLRRMNGLSLARLRDRLFLCHAMPPIRLPRPRSVFRVPHYTRVASRRGPRLRHRARSSTPLSRRARLHASASCCRNA